MNTRYYGAMNLLTTMLAGLVVLATLSNAEVICGKQPPLKPVRCVCGTLVDAIGEPIADATVKVAKGGRDLMTVKTASDGKFIFNKLKPGSYDLTAQALGFSMFRSAIVLVAPEQKCRRGLVVLLETGLETCASSVIKQ